MAFVTIVSSRYQVNAPVSTDLLSDIVTDLTFLNNNQNAPGVTQGVPNVVNGSFELDAAGTLQATGWLFTAGTGGSGSVVNTQFNDGAQSFEAIQGTVAGNTAGTLIGPYNQATASQQYYVISPTETYRLGFQLMCNRADIQNSVVVNFYTNTQAFISSLTALTLATGSSPTSWTTYAYEFNPPSNAYYITVQFNLGSNNSTPPGASGNIFVDGVKLQSRTPYSSVSVNSNILGVSNSSTVTVFTVANNSHQVKLWLYDGRAKQTSLFYLDVASGDIFKASLISSNGVNALALTNSRTGSWYSATGGASDGHASFSGVVVPYLNYMQINNFGTYLGAVYAAAMEY